MGTEGLEPSRPKLVNGFSFMKMDYTFTMRIHSSFRLVSAPQHTYTFGSGLVSFP